MLFNPKYDPTSIPTITGHALARGHRTASQRAGLAAQLVAGERVLTKPTIKQVASLLRVSRHYVTAALKTTPAGRACLVSRARYLTVPEPNKPSPPEPNKPSPCDLLVRDWNAATDAERIAFARRVGVDRIFDGAIAPVIG
jgi:hypothetical protein